MHKLTVLLLLLTFFPFASRANEGDSIGTVSATSQLPPTSDLPMRVELRKLGIDITEGNEVELLPSGQEKFDDLFAEIGQARSFVHLEYFNFRNDSIANLLFDLLEKKVKEGVEVRAMYDAFGNWSNNQPIKRRQHNEIRQRGINLVKYDPLTFPWVNHIIPRDHRKIVVIDGKVGYTGGMNVADYYIKGTEVVGSWHDMHAHIEGPAVNRLHQIFTNIWKKETKEVIEGELYFPQPVRAGDKEVAIIDRCAGKTSKNIRRLYVTMLNSAQRSVKIINPYFVPTHSIRRALKKAIKRGVDVQIMLSLKSDIPLTPDASFYVGNNLMKRGAKVYLYKGGFHHTKVMMVDSLYCTVGSANLNSRSLRYDYEINTVVFSQETTRQLLDIFNRDVRHSDMMLRGWWRKRTFGQRFLGWFGNLLTPFL